MNVKMAGARAPTDVLQGHTRDSRLLVRRPKAELWITVDFRLLASRNGQHRSGVATGYGGTTAAIGS